MSEIEKRRLVNQLPSVLQTDVLKNFFSATVDHLFQNGKSENISGYIGQKPSYYDSTKDFYISEPTTERQSYQLEPMMLSAGSDGTITNKLCYSDLIKYLEFHGSNVSNHDNLFSNEYYSWGPPIDLDKINNYLQYVWIGGFDDATAESTVLKLKVPRKRYIYDGNTSKAYALPLALTIFNGTQESPVVLVNGKVAQFNLNNGQIVLVDFPAVGAVIETIRYGDLTKLIQDSTSVPLFPFLKWESTYSGLVGNTYTATIAKSYVVGDIVYVGDDLGNGDLYVCNRAHTVTTTAFEDSNWTITTGAYYATSGHRVRLLDGTNDGDQYILDFYKGAIQMSPDLSNSGSGSVPFYITSDRTSKDRNIWALRNLWIHKSALEWTGQDFTDRKAKRPIIEFLPNIELYNYGFNRLEDVQAVLTSTQADLTDNFDIYTYDYNVWGQDKINLSRINGKLFGRMNGTDDTYMGSVLVDDGYVLQPNDRLLVIQGTSNEPALNQYIYRVVSNEGTPLPSGASADVIELVLEDQPILGDIVKIVSGKGRPASTSEFTVFSDVVEYWYNGEEWVRAQNGVAPLFKLFDVRSNYLGDDITYPSTNFAGSKLFSYVVGTGDNDPYIGQPLEYNAYQQPVFQVDNIVNRYTYSGGEIIGYYYHHFFDTDTYSNNWFKSATRSTQTVVDGVYQVPLNLQANPLNDEVRTITRNQWFDHFNDLMSKQVGFTGHSYTVNNWRDTAKDYSFGDQIVQHSAPLLKTMLFASDDRFDVIEAIKYASSEYNRFRNRFIQTILEIEDETIMASDAAPADWVSVALARLKLNKTIEFPFSFSTVGGDQYFIPPTPAALGLGKLTLPELTYDTTFSSPLLVVKGHDGSLTPAFGNFIDDIMVSLELLIYNNVSDTIKTNGPVVEINDFISSVSATEPYTHDDFNNIALGEFFSWTQSNGLNFYANDTYDSNDPFTWNYSSKLDRYGNTVAGNWRGIYQSYYDTDKPHSNPWEMLGFYEKPSYWDSVYGVAPYTRGNTTLWDDVRDGAVYVSDVRTTVARYARPEIYSYIPVDEYGNLLDPIQARIIGDVPTVQEASLEWKFGDVGPVEYLWRSSVSFPFAKAIASFLLKPTDFVELGWDTINNIEQYGQYTNLIYGNRPKNEDIFVHGELNGTERVYGSGVQQWISDYMLSKGRSPSILGDAIRGLDVKLGYKMGAYTDKSNIKILADNFGVVPSQDIEVELYTSPPTKTANYSGILIEKMNIGWRVVGYDFNHPWFDVIYGDINGPKGSISLGTETNIINKWLSGSYYPINTLVNYNGTVYKSIKDHLSTSEFQQQYWEATSLSTIEYPKVTTYLNGTGAVTKVPYGTVLMTIQDVADVMLGHQRYLETQGWYFNDVDESTQERVDFDRAVFSFLEWSQVSWAVGNFITLSPLGAMVKFDTQQGYISDVTENHYVIDRSGGAISSSDVAVNRLDGHIEVQAREGNIFGLTLEIREIEHVMMFNNETVFGNLIYSPLFNLRQPRLKLIGKRSVDWSGRLDAPGYVLIGNDIKSNFDKQVEDFRYAFDIEQNDNTLFSDMARHVIGYDARSYLTDLVVSDTQQFEFYQGMIHQKGAVGNFDKLMRSDFIDQNRDIKFFEEWALKIDDFGTKSNQQISSIVFEKNDIKSNPQLIHFAVDETPNTFQNNWLEISDTVSGGIDSKWITRAENPLALFTKRDTYAKASGDLPVSGFVRLDEATYTAFNKADIPSIYSSNMNVGETVWTHTTLDSKAITNSSNSVWYLLGNYANGAWDGGANVSTDASYIAVNSDGDTVFRSKTQDSPFVTNNTYFVPVPTHTYKVEFKVRKIAPSTNGVPSYVRPAFDAFDSNGVAIGSLQAVGDKYGYGYDSSNDLINTSTWVVNEWYTVGAEWVAPSTPVIGSARGRIRVNRTWVNNADGPPFSNALYEIGDQTIFVSEKKEWDIFKIFHLSEDNTLNTAYKFDAFNTDLGVSTTRIYLNNPHGLSTNDIGEYLIVGGSSYTSPELEGVHKIFGYGIDYVEIYSFDNQGYDFTADGNTGTPEPSIRILRSMHFKNTDHMSDIISSYSASTGDLVYVDGTDTTPWTVYSIVNDTTPTDDYDQSDNLSVTSNTLSWNIKRIQPKRIHVKALKNVKIYDQQTNITPSYINPVPTVIDSVSVLNPITGRIFETINRNINYKSSFDPATYSNIAAATDTFADTVNDIYGVWGETFVGKIWWDLSTVRFLETDTDNVIYGLTDSVRYETELQYRLNNFGTIAPACSVDIYEWIQSDVDPETYTTLSATDSTGSYSGTVYNADGPSWVERVEFDSVGKKSTAYFFWVKGRTISSTNSGMTTDFMTSILTNPKADDMPWIGITSPNSCIISGVGQSLKDQFDDNSGTVLQFETGDDFEGIKHDEWLLLRQADERSLAPDWVWDKFKNSMVGFDDRRNTLPPPVVVPVPQEQENGAPVWVDNQ